MTTNILRLIEKAIEEEEISIDIYMEENDEKGQKTQEEIEEEWFRN